ncbi:uncharacterized protein LOC135482299 [Liolophura sinensis]|uniref:uncharacterized protein LOC135482299 n=1 Tax=Liolophura sinensis TaxID=3198878 RepID=UPI00315817F4
MRKFLSIRHRIIHVVSVILLEIVLGNSLHWDALQSEKVPSHGLYTEPTLRDVSFRDVSFTLAMLSWTVDGVTETKLVSVDLFVKRLSDTRDVVWHPLSQLSFNHSVSSSPTNATRFGRDLNVVHGEAYRANVTLMSGIKNMVSTVDVTTVPFGPKTVNLNNLEATGTKAVAATFDNTRIDAYFGQFERPDKKLVGTFGPYPLDRPILTESEVWVDTSLPFGLVPGETYRLVLAFYSWERRSSTLTTSNYRTIAPSAPVIEQAHRLSNGSLRVTWMLSTGIADIFLVTVNGKKHVIRGDNHVTSAGRYSADIDGLKDENDYFITVTAESNRTQGQKSQSFTYINEDGVFPNDGGLDLTPSSNGNIIAPWVISGVLVVIVLILAVILGLTIRKLRQLRTTIRKSDNLQPQPEYETIRTSYLHPI